MTTSIGGVTIDFLANTAGITTEIAKAEKAVSSSSARMGKAMGQFDTGLTKSVGGIKGFAKELFSVQSLVAGFAGGLAGALSFGAITQGFQAALNVAGELVDTADRLGITTQALQELRFAATQSGVETAQFDTALQKLQTRLGDVRAGNEQAAKSFDQLGLTQDILSGQIATTDQAFVAVAEKLAGFQDQSAAAAAAADIFGDRVGPKLLGFLRQGAGGIDELRAKALELGIVMDDSLIRSAEEAGDTLDALWQVVSAKVTIAFANAAPAVADFTDKVFASLPAITQWIAKAEAFAQRAQQVGIATAALEQLLPGEEQTRRNVLDGEIAAGEAQLAALQRALEDARLNNNAARAQQLEGQISSLRGNLQELEQRARQAAELSATGAPPPGGAGTVALPPRAAPAAAPAPPPRQAPGVPVARPTAPAARQAVASVRDVETAAEELNRLWEETGRLSEVAFDGATVSLGEMTDGLDGVRQSVLGVQDPMAEIDAIAKQIGAATETSFDGAEVAIVGAGDGLDALRASMLLLVDGVDLTPVADQVAALREQFVQGAISADQFGQKMQGLKEAAGEAGSGGAQSMESIGEEVRRQNQYVDAFAYNLESTLGDAFMGAEVSVRQFAATVLEEFSRMLLSSAINGVIGMIATAGTGAAAGSTAAQGQGGNAGGAGGGLGSLFGFARGGSFEVGGAGGPDSKVAAFRVSPGEMVDISPKMPAGFARAAEGRVANGNVEVKIDARGATNEARMAAIARQQAAIGVQEGFARLDRDPTARGRATR